MHRLYWLPFVALTAFANLSMAAPAVGVATCAAIFTLDDTKVDGNATLFDGSRVETGIAPCPIQLNNGAKLQLGADSKATVYLGHMVLEQGSARFAQYAAEASVFRIQATGLSAAAEISIRTGEATGPRVVRVGAIHGAVRVTTGHGVLLSNLSAGRTLDFRAPDHENEPLAAPIPVSGSSSAAPAATGSSTIALGGGTAAKVGIVSAIAAGAGAAAGIAFIEGDSAPPSISPSSR